MRTTIAVIFTTMVFLALSSGANAQEIHHKYQNKYQNLEVGVFTVAAGIDFPADYMTKLQKEVVTEVGSKRKFKRVFSSDRETWACPKIDDCRVLIVKPPVSVEGPRVILQGEVIEFNPGNRALRALTYLGPLSLAGHTKVVVHFRFVDAASGAVVYEDNADGKVIAGWYGAASSKGAVSGLATELAKKAKNYFF